MEEQEVLEQEQEQEETQETETTTMTQNGQTMIFNLNSNDEQVLEPLPVNSENIIHQLFSELGVDLDYTPTSGYQCFTMALQFAAALWFIWWIVKLVFSCMREMFKR